MEQLSASIWDDLVSADEDKVYFAIDKASEYFSNQPTKLADSSVISRFIQLFSDGPVNAVVTMAKILGSTLINDSGRTPEIGKMLINAGGLPVILQNSQDVNPDIRESALHLLQGLAENGCVGIIM